MGYHPSRAARLQSATLPVLGSNRWWIILARRLLLLSIEPRSCRSNLPILPHYAPGDGGGYQPLTKCTNLRHIAAIRRINEIVRKSLIENEVKWRHQHAIADAFPYEVQVAERDALAACRRRERKFECVECLSAVSRDALNACRIEPLRPT